MLPLRLIRWREITPLELSLLPVCLPQGDGELRLHQLLAEVERVTGILDAELIEDLLDVGAADEQLVVEDGDGLPVGEDAEVGVGHLRPAAVRSSASS